MNVKLTPAQQQLLNGVLALVGAALVGACTAFIQQYQNAPGPVNLQTCLLAALATFGALFWPALYHYIPAHFQLILQSKDDALKQAEDKYADLLAAHQTLTQTHNMTVAALNNAVTPVLVRSAVSPSQSAAMPVVSGDTIPRVQAMVAQSEPIAPGG